jgi:hypothetical protein
MFVDSHIDIFSDFLKVGNTIFIFEKQNSWIARARENRVVILRKK